jgi:hypothetical protein
MWYMLNGHCSNSKTEGVGVGARATLFGKVMSGKPWLASIDIPNMSSTQVSKIRIRAMGNIGSRYKSGESETVNMNRAEIEAE